MPGLTGILFLRAFCGLHAVQMLNTFCKFLLAKLSKKGLYTHLHTWLVKATTYIYNIATDVDIELLVPQLQFQCPQIHKSS